MVNKVLPGQADNCVYCGLCSQYCPTYAQDHQELESPRGRVVSSIYFLQGQLALTREFEQHIKNCLFCGACERACPAKVSVLELFSEVKAKFAHKEATFLRWLSRHQKIFGLLTSGAVSLKKLGLGKMPMLNKYRHLLEKSGVKFDTRIKSDIGLFTGCSKSLDSAPGDIQTVFATLGVQLEILPDLCCGAVHAHAGDIERADKLVRENRHNLSSYKTIIYANSGCQSHVKKLKSNNLTVLEASELLSISQELQGLKPKSLNKTIAIHLPCSQQYNPKAGEQIKQMLSTIPKITLKTMQNKYCCGASKIYSGKNSPSFYVQNSIDEIIRLDPDVVVSSNLACRLNLKAALADPKKNVKIMHPVSLLKQQL